MDETLLRVDKTDDELKEYCNYEIGTREEQSVLIVLEKFVEQYNLNFLKECRK